MRIMSINELQKIQSFENNEPMVAVDEETSILCEYRRKDSHLNKILVRKSVAIRLVNVQKRLKKFDSTLNLLVTEGYRHPFYQEQYFLMHFKSLALTNPWANLEDLQELTHQFVALPSVAGHPTGGAIDLTIVREGQEIDMGCAIADFSDPQRLPTYSKVVNEHQAKNRSLLHDLMILEGFAPFYGEWWHFSYGDREWAAFYSWPQTLYTQSFYQHKIK